TYLHKHTASAKYVARVEWDGATFPVPAGHTRELETGANRAQAAADIAAQAAADFAAGQEGLREQARDFIRNDPRPEMKALRALALVVLDEINLVRQNPAAVLAARTPAQLLNAMVAKVADGSAD
ncbi:MAG: hypothetical protein H0V63_13985, partial [Burkholderiaceae bacterium]|nr:hypothetical protein [Burkholderiaceae bacterium]